MAAGVRPPSAPNPAVSIGWKKPVKDALGAGRRWETRAVLSPMPRFVVDKFLEQLSRSAITAGIPTLDIAFVMCITVRG